MTSDTEDPNIATLREATVNYIVTTADDSNVSSFECDSPQEAARLWAIEFVHYEAPHDWADSEPIEVWVTDGSGVHWRYTVKPKVDAEVVRL